MSRAATVVAVGLALVSSAVAGVSVWESRALRRELESRQLLPAPGMSGLAEGGASGPLPPPAEVAARVLELEKVNERLASDLEERTRGLTASLSSLASREEETRQRVEETHRIAASLEVKVSGAAGLPLPAAPRGGGAGADGMDPAKIQQLVASTVDEKMQALKRQQEKKPTLEEFSAELKLDDVQQQSVTREVFRGQEGVLEVLGIRGADGTDYREQLFEAYSTAASGDPEKAPQAYMKVMALFGRLMTDKIPGTDETYVTRINKVKAGVSDSFRNFLTNEQYEAYQKMGQDPTEVQISGNPFEREFIAWTKKRQEASGQGGG
ncbi:MAG: hypothetical protein L0216_17160 [Planctomycetales bacterium]|nr:hypothetical protein [Planctomycetales bacterium]